MLIGVEKNNDDAKKNYTSSNKWDTAKDILEKEYKCDEMRKTERTARPYK